jgi:acyl carrier protein
MVYEILKRLISDLFAIDEQKIRKSMSFYDDLMADSLDIVELLMAVEEEFDLEPLENEDVSQFETVGDMLEFIKARVD